MTTTTQHKTVTQIEPEILAREFSRVLAEYISVESVQNVVKLNKLETNPGVCHSHDFCDANMAMIEAVSNVTGIPEMDCYITDDSHHVAINKAWDLAKENGFYLV